MKIITSLSNPEVKLVSSLHHAKYRKEENLFIAEGKRTCSTLLQAGMEPEAVYVASEQFNDARELVNESEIIEVTSEVMKKMTAATTPSGLLMIFKIPAQPSLNALTQGLVLAQISDPGNMGTLLRTAAAMNIKTVICIEGTDVWSPKVIQASAGNIAFLTIYQISWQTLLEHKKNLSLCALVVQGGKNPDQINFTNSLLIIGSEAHGIPADWVSKCDQKMTIPMPGKAESLNAAVAGSIAAYLAFGK